MEACAARKAFQPVQLQSIACPNSYSTTALSRPKPSSVERGILFWCWLGACEHLPRRRLLGTTLREGKISNLELHASPYCHCSTQSPPLAVSGGNGIDEGESRDGLAAGSVHTWPSLDEPCEGWTADLERIQGQSVSKLFSLREDYAVFCFLLFCRGFKCSTIPRPGGSVPRELAESLSHCAISQAHAFPFRQDFPSNRGQTSVVLLDLTLACYNRCIFVTAFLRMHYLVVSSGHPSSNISAGHPLFITHHLHSALRPTHSPLAQTRISPISIQSARRGA